MTPIPKDKAILLVNTCYITLLRHGYTDSYNAAKDLAIVFLIELEKQECKLLGYESAVNYSSEYCQEVKQEIENL